jgi:type I restriction enzyme R subunit
MIEFKQIVGRGTRLFDGKEYFTIYDFVDAYKHFSDPEWDGDPISEEIEEGPRGTKGKGIKGTVLPPEPLIEPKKKLKIKLRDGKEREIQHMISTSFWDANGKPISAEEFLKNIFGALPEFFKNEDELRSIWANPVTRRVFLFKMSELGYDQEKLQSLQNMINADDSDLFDVLAYISFAIQPVTREERVSEVKSIILEKLNDKEMEFLDFVLTKYLEKGFEELGEEIVITKRGRPVARLSPLKKGEAFNILGCMTGQMAIKGDIESALDVEWNAEKGTLLNG